MGEGGTRSAGRPGMPWLLAGKTGQQDRQEIKPTEMGREGDPGFVYFHLFL